MSKKMSLRMTSAAAPYVGADKPREDRLKAAAGRVKLPPVDFVALVYYLCHDPDPEVKGTALSTLRRLATPFLAHLLKDPELHPRILDALVQLHFAKAELVPLFLAHPMLSEKAAGFLAAKSECAAAAGGAAATAARENVPKEGEEVHREEAAEDAPRPESGEQEESGPVDETTEEYQTKYQLAQTLGVGEKIKMALTGDKEWRTLLLKDSNKLVSSAVIKNPRMTEGEVLTVAKSQVQNDEILRIICANKDWIKNALIRKALVWNHKTPLPTALRFVSTLGEKDLAQLAKSKNVSSAVASAARKILLSKKEGR